MAAVITPPVERIVEPDDRGAGGQTWYQPLTKKDFLCLIGLHWPDVLRADGFLGYFDHVRRLRCPCGKWEWTEYNGREVAKERVDPALDAEMAVMEVRMREARATAKAQRDAHVPTCWGIPGNCQSCGCSEDGPCVSHRPLYE